ncbi:MAG: trehalose-phosphatase [Chloroflexota bacterium]
MAEELRDIEPLRSLLAHRPLAILSDIDGTIAPIVPNPEDSRVSNRARDALQSLMSEGVSVGFITGRAIEKARDIVGVLGAYYAGNHGLNIAMDGAAEAPEELRPYVAWAQQVIADTCGLNIPGVIVEDKGPVVAFHYRMAESEDDARRALESAISASPSSKNFRVQVGRKVIELRPPVAIDKGTAVETLASRIGARAVLTMGDDATDLDMFRGARELQKHGVASASVAVWSNEVQPEVLEETDYFVRGVEGVEWLLEEVLKAIRP